MKYGTISVGSRWQNEIQIVSGNTKVVLVDAIQAIDMVGFGSVYVLTNGKTSFYRKV